MHSILSMHFWSRIDQFIRVWCPLWLNHSDFSSTIFHSVGPDQPLLVSLLFLHTPVILKYLELGTRDYMTQMCHISFSHLFQHIKQLPKIKAVKFSFWCCGSPWVLSNQLIVKSVVNEYSVFNCCQCLWNFKCISIMAFIHPSIHYLFYLWLCHSFIRFLVYAACHHRIGICSIFSLVCWWDSINSTYLYSMPSLTTPLTDKTSFLTPYIRWSDGLWVKSTWGCQICNWDLWSFNFTSAFPGIVVTW